MLVVALAATVAFTSCETDEDYSYLLRGTWTADYAGDNTGDHPLSEDEVDQYSFYDNGSGLYSYYNDLGQWVGVRFDWRENGSGSVALWYEDGINDVLYYDFDRFGNLVLSHNPGMSPYTGYRPGR